MSATSKKNGHKDDASRSGFDAKLVAYCAMAGGAFVLAQTADAAIIYSGVKNLTIDSDNKSMLAIDLDGGGAADFEFRNFLFVDSAGGPSGSYLHKGGYNFIMPEAVNSVGGFFDPFVPLPPTINFNAGVSIPEIVKLWLNQVNYTAFSIFPAQAERGLLLNLGFYHKDPVNGTTVSAPFNPSLPFMGFNGTTGYLGVKFQINEDMHYGWIQYKGPVTDNDTNIFTGTIVDWAYENKALTPLLAGQKPCIDNDGDGYGVGAGCFAADCNDNDPAIHDNCTCIDNDGDGYGDGTGCLGPDCNDNNPAIHENCTCIDKDGDGYGDGTGCIAADCDDNNPAIHENCPPPPCEVALTPGSISKFFSRFFPFKIIAIRGTDNATITKDSAINWGTDGVNTLVVLPSGKNTIKAVVRILPLSLQGGETFEVTVGDCVGQLSVRPF